MVQSSSCVSCKGLSCYILAFLKKKLRNHQNLVVLVNFFKNHQITRSGWRSLVYSHPNGMLSYLDSGIFMLAGVTLLTTAAAVDLIFGGLLSCSTRQKSFCYLGTSQISRCAHKHSKCQREKLPRNINWMFEAYSLAFERTSLKDLLPLGLCDYQGKALACKGGFCHGASVVIQMQKLGFLCLCNLIQISFFHLEMLLTFLFTVIIYIHYFVKRFSF